MGFIIKVVLAVIIIGYLLGKDDVATVRSPDLFAPKPINTNKNEIKQTEVIPQKPSSSSPFAYWESSTSWQDSDLSNYDDWFDPTNPISPFHPFNSNSNSGSNSDSNSGSSFEDNMFTDSFSCNDFKDPFNND